MGKPRIEIAPGMRFGRWTVIAEVPSMFDDGPPARAIKVRCDCGRENVVRVNSLARGESTQCRACADMIHRTGHVVRIHAGMRFNDWTVVRETRRDQRRFVVCRCECRTEEEVDLHALLRGTSKRCYECNGRRGAPPGRKGTLHFVAGMGAARELDAPFTRSELCATWDGAVRRLAEVCRLSAAERFELLASGFVRLWRPRSEGAQYVEILRCDCKTPEVHRGVEAAE